MSKGACRRDGGSTEVMTFCGIDVSAKTLTVAVQRGWSQRKEQREWANTAAGHRRLMEWLVKPGERVRVCLEATGIYSLDLALALDAAAGIEVAVLNPKKVREFATALGRRSKTDKADAASLAEYSRRMDFVAWRRPASSALQLRALGRHIARLTAEHTRLGNRLHAAQGSAATPRCVRDDLKRSRAGLQKRLLRLRREAVKIIQQVSEMQRKFQQLMTMPGIAENSAIGILSELAGLDPQLTVRQWVAHSGLDPTHHDSGTSVHKPSRISRAGSRHLRRALYMPALTAARFDPHMKAFYHLLQARNKSKLQALMAVARKLLHAIFGIFKTNTPYDGRILFPNLVAV